MGLNFLRSSKKHELIPEARKLLEDYMAGAVKEIGFVKKEKAEVKANDYAEDFHKSGKDVGLSKADIKAMEKQVAKELKNYSNKLECSINTSCWAYICLSCVKTVGKQIIKWDR